MVFSVRENFKEKKTSNILNAIEESRNTTLDKLIFAIGIPNIGKKAAKQLADKYKTMEALMNATKEDLLSLDDFGEIMAQGVVDYWANEKHVEDIKTLLDRGVTISVKEVANGPLSGKKVVLTGSLPHLKRSQAKELIEENGGECSDSISKTINLVVAGEDAGSKLQKAQKLGIEIIDEAKLLELIGITL